MRRVWPHCCLVLLALPWASAAAQMTTDPAADRLPAQLGDVEIQQRLNQPVPLQLAFRDETGRMVRLADYFQPGKPVILSLVYYKCPMLCSQVLASLAVSLRFVKFDAGKQFQVLTVSFDPRETPAQAAVAKTKFLPMYHHPGTDDGWHFLTGDQASITALANAVGFHFRWDARTQQFAHATGIMILTPQGRVSQYYYGARYFPTDLRFGLIQASQNQIGTLADQIVLYCYHWDPHTGRYGVIVSRVIQVSGGVTVLVVGSMLILLFRAEPNRGRRKRGPPRTETECGENEPELSLETSEHHTAERRAG